MPAAARFSAVSGLLFDSSSCSDWSFFVVGLLDQRGEADACSRHRLLAAFAGLLLLFAQYPGGERGGFLGEDQVLQTRPLLHVAEGTLDESFTERLVNRL